MFLKALGVKYLSRYKSYHAPWTVEIESNGQKKTFRIDEFLLSANREINGSGTDELGEFKVFGTVSKQGFAEFEKRYTTGGLKPVASFHGVFTNAMLKGNWVIKGQGSGLFEMKMEGAEPYALKVANLQEVIYLKFVKDNTRIHSVGLLTEHKGLNKRFFILNGKLFGEKKGENEFAMKFLYPDSSDEDYYMGALTEDHGVKKLIGTMEIHGKKEWFSKGKTFPFELVQLSSNSSGESGNSSSQSENEMKLFPPGKMQLPTSFKVQETPKASLHLPFGETEPPKSFSQSPQLSSHRQPGTPLSQSPHNGPSPVSPLYLAHRPQPPKTS